VTGPPNPSTTPSKGGERLADRSKEAYEAALLAGETHGYQSLNYDQKQMVDKLVKEASARGKRAKAIVGLK